MNTSNFEEIDLENVKQYPLSDRDNIVSVEDFCSLPDPDGTVGEFLESLPSILAADDFRTVCQEVASVTGRDGFVGAGIGAHVIKTGCTPVFQDLLRKKILRCITMHGAVAIHDFELALIGETSEDVQENIWNGKFGMWQETAEGFGDACRIAREEEIGLGAAYGKLIAEDDEMKEEHSVLATCWKLDVPVTVHLALGTDIVHMHPDFDPAEAGEATMRDFRLLCGVLRELQQGVWLNIGSAVLLPEVFLKAISVVRNQGEALDDFLAVNFDMIQHYRPHQNVVGRPAPRGISITGHHEMLLPLFRLGVLHYLHSHES